MRERVPHAAARLSQQVTALVQRLRTLDLYKVPGVSETLDWVAALAALDRQELDLTAVEETLGVVLKSREDQQSVRGAGLSELLRAAVAG